MTKAIVILGAGWAGLPLAHKLLKYTLPKTKDGLKVYLVSPNSHFYWNLAAVRGIIPGAISDQQLFLPIELGFAQYPAEAFEFILGKAQRINPDNNTVEVARNDRTSLSLHYDQLAIATGSQIHNNLPFKSVGTHEETLTALHSLQKQISLANTIVIAGAGPTGVETAGEIAAAYGAEKDITLIMSGKHVLQNSNVLPSVSRVIESDLERLGVKLIRETQVTSVQPEAKIEEDTITQTTIALSNGTTIITDLYIPLFGIKLNTSLVPNKLLDSSTGSLVLDKTMLVMGTKNIWGIGDVGNIEAKQVTVIDAQIVHLSRVLDSILTEDGTQIEEYKPSEKTMIFITLGKKYATGQIGGWKLFGWLVRYVKGRDLFLNTAEKYVNGKQLRHKSM